MSDVDTSIPAKVSSLNPGPASTTIVVDLGSSVTAKLGLVGYLVGDVDGSFAGTSGVLHVEDTQPTYFTDLVANHIGLSLAQFGVYA